MRYETSEVPAWGYLRGSLIAVLERAPPAGIRIGGRTSSEMRELEQLERPKGNWWLRNRVILLDAERRQADIYLAPIPAQLAIVGAQRSGTTWA